MKNIIISGASRGIGFALVEFFAKQNHNVLALSRNVKTLKNVSKNVTVLEVDITKESDLSKVTKFISSNWKKKV